MIDFWYETLKVLNLFKMSCSLAVKKRSDILDITKPPCPKSISELLFLPGCFLSEKKCRIQNRRLVSMPIGYEVRTPTPKIWFQLINKVYIMYVYTYKTVDCCFLFAIKFSICLQIFSYNAKSANMKVDSSFLWNTIICS